jgi:hypothetical protein
MNIVWRKSSYSASNGNCVEVGWAEPGVAVRDSKQVTSPTLAFEASAWREFLIRTPKMM